MGTTNTHDPVAAFLSFAVEAGVQPDKTTRLSDYMEKLGDAMDRAERLSVAWMTEASVLSSDRREDPKQLSFLVPAQKPTKPQKQAELLPGLGTYLARRPRPSVRKATFAAIYFGGAQRPAAIHAMLDAHSFKFGKGPAGNQIRSALWHARKGGQIIERNGMQDFATDQHRADFEAREIRGNRKAATA